MNTLLAAIAITSMMWTANPGETFNTETIGAFKEVCATYKLPITSVGLDSEGNIIQLNCKGEGEMETFPFEL